MYIFQNSKENLVTWPFYHPQTCLELYTDMLAVCQFDLTSTTMLSYKPNEGILQWYLGSRLKFHMLDGES